MIYDVCVRICPLPKVVASWLRVPCSLFYIFGVMQCVQLFLVREGTSQLSSARPCLFGACAAAIQDVLTKQKYSPTMVNFFGALAENNRLPETAGVLTAFETLMSAHRNEVQCKITSAKVR